MAAPTATGQDLAGVLALLAGVTKGALPGPVLAANMAWPAINGHGIKAATLNANGSPQYELADALSVKAGLTSPVGVNLACNLLAGTTGIEADLALRIYAGLP